MAQEHLTTFGASASAWVRALALACSAALCIASVGCGGDDGPGVLGPGLDPPKGNTSDGGLTGHFGNGNGGKGGTGGRSVGDDGTIDGDGSGGRGGEEAADASTPPSCPSSDAGIPSSDAGVDAGDGCEEDAGVSH